MYDFDLLMNFEFDSNGDGFPDTYVEGYDTTGDGEVDIAIMTSDTNGDGYAETTSTFADTNNSGEFDTYSVQQDTNADGEVDVVSKMHDYTQDGEIDTTTTYVDSDHDGKFDTVVKEVDSDGDGQIDKMDVFEDANGSGEADYHEVYDYDPATGQITPATAAGYEVGGIFDTGLDNFQPGDNYPEGISGNPAESMEYWEHQGPTNRCALYSQKFVIEELTPGDEVIDIEEFADVAEEHGWFTEDGGTSLLNMNNMLDYYGIENEMSFNNSIEDIEDCLNDGGKVIVSVDSDEIWYGEADDMFAPDSASDHAVEVIGVDRTDPEHPMVILNDSGTPDGRGEMVPLDVFEGAWADGDCQMIECYPE